MSYWQITLKNIMACIEYTNLILGALLGACFGFIISELKQFFSNREKKITLKKHFLKYDGVYSVVTKGGHESKLKEVEIKYLKENILELKLETETNKSASGYIVMDESTLSYGKAFYKHTDPEHEHQSGFYDVIFFEPGIIHAKVSYIHKKTREEINEFYIWTRNN
jgi:hypothetical protein